LSQLSDEPHWDRFVASVRGAFALPDGAALDASDRLVEDIGLDSLAIYEIAIALEESAGHELDAGVFESITTLGDVYLLLRQFTT
jgi:acyl carrier protein